MPQPSGGSPIVPPGGDRASGGSSLDHLKKETEAREKLTQATVKQAKELKELIEFLKEEKKEVGITVEREEQLTEAFAKLNEKYEKTFDTIKKIIQVQKDESSLLRQTVARYNDLSSSITSLSASSRGLLQSFHSYNLEVQRTVDLSGRFVGASQRGRQEFEKFRNELKLTREEAVKFGQTWSAALRMGASTDQITRAVSKLKDAFGHAGGQAAAATIAQIPMSRTTLRGVLTGDASAMERALRNANMEQAHALGGLRRGPGDALSQEDVRFQNVEALMAKVGDDLETSMAAGAAAGLGPEMGALAVPLAQINLKMGRILEWALGSRAWLGSFLGGSVGARLAGGGLGSALGGAGGIGAIGGLLRPFVGKLSLGGLAAAGAGYGFDALAAGMEPGGTAQRLTRGAGSLSRVAGYGLTGAALGSAIGPAGTVVGGIAGTAVGAYAEIGDEITGAIESGFKGFGQGLEGVIGGLMGRTAADESPIGALDKDFNAVREGLQKQIAGVAADLGSLPENIQSQLSQSRMATALESIDPTQMFEIGTDASRAFSASLKLAGQDWREQSQVIFEAKERVEAALRWGRIDKTKRDQKISSLNALDAIQAQSMGDVLGQNPAQKAAAGMMQQIEIRGGQLGEETEAVRTRYQRTGAGTGDVAQSRQVQEQANRAYQENLRMMEELGGKAMEGLRAGMVKVGEERDAAMPGTEARKSLDTAYSNMENQLRDTQRKLNKRKEILGLENQNLNVEAAREQAMSAEESILFRRAKQNQALLQAQESYLRESGARPEEIGAVVRQQATESGAQLSKFMESFDDQMSALQTKLQRNDLSAPERVQTEETIFILANKRVELESKLLQDRKRAASGEEEYRQAQIGANRRIAEINRDMSARVGQSWRVQMGYQSQIIRLQQEDLQSSRRELEGMAQALGGEARAMQDPGFLNKLADLAQKQAGLAEAIIGKQRNFLEQATAAGFGVGSGSRVSPIINPRMFGEQIQGFTGMRQPGAPLTVAQNRAMLLRGMGPQVFGGIPGGMGAGPGGVPGGVPGEVPGGVPGGAPGGFVGPPRPPGLGGLQAMQATDVSGQIVVRIESTNPNVKAEVEKVAIMMSRPGFIG